MSPISGLQPYLNVKQLLVNKPMDSNSRNLLLLTGNEIDNLLCNRDQDILEAVKLAYQAHDRGNTIMPANSYLRFPNKEKERIIAKPAYLGESFEVAGIKCSLKGCCDNASNSPYFFS